MSGTRGAVFGPGLTTPPGAFGFSAQARPSLGSTWLDATGDTQTWPYLGIGYSDSSLRGGWGFSADLGLAAQSFGLFRAARSLGNQSLDDVVRTRVYLTSAGDFDAVSRVHGELLGRVRPANTTVVVAQLLNPAWKVEIEVDAVIGQKVREPGNLT